mmetsp:Transcript_52114/g.113635  ORF Transcript_52114/g.113635 Transcript_52114/m.113635 type:complete len:540 (+) Transcript_52114:48-1667(+)
MSRLAAITSFGDFGTEVHAEDVSSLGDFLPKVKMTDMTALSAGLHRFHSASDYASFFQCDRSHGHGLHGLNGLNGPGRHLTGFTDATENPTEKILQMNSKVINITGRLGEKQLKDPATDSTEWEVNQKLCEEDQCKQSRAHVTVKECVKMEKPKGDHGLPPLPEGHWRDGGKECRYIQMPLALILSDHGRCLSAASSANSISEECSVSDCGDAKGCNQCWLLQRATENNVFTGWKLKTACGLTKKGVENGQFLTQDADGTLKFTDEYDTQQDRQIWNLTEAETKQMDPEELNTEIFKKPFMLENLASKRFLLQEKPQLDDDAAKTDPLNQDMANLPDKENMPESFKNDTAEANSQTIVRKKQWRRSFWRGVEKAGSTYLQGEMMRADGDSVPTFNYLSASPDKGFDSTKHLRAEELSDDCNDRWSFVHKDRGFELKTACAKPKYLVALNNGDGPVAFHDEPYPGPEGKWNVRFAKPPPPEPPVNEEAEPVLPLPKEVPLEVEEEAAKDPESSGAALEMVQEGDAQKAVENLTENLSNQG